MPQKVQSFSKVTQVNAQYLINGSEQAQKQAAEIDAVISPPCLSSLQRV